MPISFEREGDALIAMIAGRMDSGSAPDIDRAIAEQVAAGNGRVVLDLSGVDYMSSAGIRTLIITAKSCAGRGGRLVICGLNEYPREALRLAGLLPTFTVRDDRAAAVSAL